GAPRPQIRTAVDGTRVTSFQAVGVPQLFAERAAVPAIEYVPSVRASSGVGWTRWARYLGEEFGDAIRSSPDIRDQARRLAEQAYGGRRALATALVDWVTTHIEQGDELADPASFALARGRGGRAARAVRRGSGALAPGLRAALAGRAVPGRAPARAGDRRAEEPRWRARDGAGPLLLLERAPGGAHGPHGGGRRRDEDRADVLP